MAADVKTLVPPSRQLPSNFSIRRITTDAMLNDLAGIICAANGLPVELAEGMTGSAMKVLNPEGGDIWGETYIITFKKSE